MNPIPHRAVPVDPVASDRVLAVICDTTGRPLQDSYTRDEAADLLRAAGYDVTPGTVEEFIRKGYLADPPQGEWTAVFIHALAAALECRRRWLPTPNPRHDAKKSAARLEIERLQGEGIDPPVEDLDAHTIEDLLIQIVNADQRHLRESLYECVRLKLTGFEE